MSARRLLGYVPPERHEHFTPEGVMTGYTVVTRESEWDDFERDRLLALAHYEAGVHDCGWHTDLINDPDLTFTADTRTCQVCGLAAVSERIFEANDEPDLRYLKQKHGDPLPPNVALPADGRSIVTKIQAPES